MQCAFCSSHRRPHWQGPGSGQPIADGSSLPQSAQATSGNLWRQKIGPSRAESPSSDQMKRSWLGTDRRGDSFVVRRLVSRSVSLGCSEMIGTYLTSASTTDECYGIPRPTSHVPRAQGDGRPAGGEALAQPAARSPQPSRVTSRFRRRTVQVQVQVHMYVHAYPGPWAAHHTRSVGRSVGRVTVFMHVCMYCTYTTLRSTWTAETSIIDGRRSTAEDEDENATCIPHTTSSERATLPFRFPFRFYSRTGRVEENREQRTERVRRMPVLSEDARSPGRVR